MVRLSIFRKKIAKNGELKPMYYLTFYGAERLDFDKMCDLIAERTTLDSSEVDFVLSVLQDVVIENLQIGRGIELGKRTIDACHCRGRFERYKSENHQKVTHYL